MAILFDQAISTGGNIIFSPMLSTVNPLDVSPDAFSVAPLTNQPLNQYVEFGPVTVAGVDAGVDVTVSVTNAEYAVDVGTGYGGFTSTPIDVQLGYVVKARILTPNVRETEVTGTLTIGDKSSNLSATTLDQIVVVGNAPVIDVDKPEVSNVVLGSIWNNPAYTASDVEDGNLTNAVIVTGSVDTSVEGPNTLTYQVTDSDLNTTTKTITVNVVDVIKQANITVNTIEATVGGGATIQYTSDGTLGVTENTLVLTQQQIDTLSSVMRLGKFSDTSSIVFNF
jgi:hypothetical protein